MVVVIGLYNLVAITILIGEEMKRSHFRLMFFVGAVIEVAIITMLILHIKHPIFPVLIGTWGFIAGVSVSKYKEICNG